MTKTQLINALAEEMDGTTKTHVKAFLNALTSVSGKTLKKEGKFTIPGIAKLVLVKVPPKPERKARNPSNGATMVVPAKPASKKLKARFVKALKVAVGQLPAEPAAKARKK
jgi:nucleoid DNA-binding protein